MTAERTVLTPAEARRYYDRFGRKQDTQGFYEDPALDDLLAKADFHRAAAVFEFGCGTGKLAERLLSGHLPSGAAYTGCDVSPVMVDLAVRRLQRFAGRAQVLRSGGAVRFPLDDQSVDRVVSTYVLDILSGDDIRAFYAEARRVLVPQGRLCLASLTEGVGPASKIVAGLWRRVFRLRPSLVGGCRPIRLEDHLDDNHWRPAHRRVVTPFGVPSEVLVLIRR